MYHIVASDLDGTLLSPDHRLTPFTRETLKDLTELGVHFVFATGRHHIDVSQMRDSLALNAYMITANGARVHAPDGNLLFSHDLAPAIVRDVVMLAADDPHILTNIYRDDHWYLNQDSPEWGSYFPESIFNYRIFDPNAFEAEGTSKVFFTSDNHERLLPLEEKIRARWGNAVNVCFSLPVCLEVMAGDVSKAHALHEVSQLLGYSLRSCIAFGDGMNDLEMLKSAGKAYIMGNASDRLKALLPELSVIGTNAEEAVPHMLRALFLREEKLLI